MIVKIHLVEKFGIVSALTCILRDKCIAFLSFVIPSHGFPCLFLQYWGCTQGLTLAR
jgi:hypothetical protein